MKSIAAMDCLLLLKTKIIGFKTTDVKQQRMMITENTTEGSIEMDRPDWKLIISLS